jgi:stage V sporulation protein G
MQLTEVRISLCGDHTNRLKAFCSLTFDDAFVIRDVKLIDGHDGPFLAMPSRKLTDHCPRCSEKNHLRARFCSNCGTRLNEQRSLRHHNGSGPHRLKLHADIAHPISAHCRQQIEERVMAEYYREVERSKQPGYVPANLDADDMEMYSEEPMEPRLRPTGTH